MAELVYSFMFPLLFVDGRLIKLKTGKQSLEAKEDKSNESIFYILVYTVFVYLKLSYLFFYTKVVKLVC